MEAWLVLLRASSSESESNRPLSTSSGHGVELRRNRRLLFGEARN